MNTDLRNLNTTVEVGTAIAVLDQYTKTVQVVTAIIAREPEDRAIIENLSSSLFLGIQREVELLRFLREGPKA